MTTYTIGNTVALATDTANAPWGITASARGWLTISNGEEERKVRAKDVVPYVPQHSDEDEPQPRGMAKTLNRYRGNYEPHLTPQGKKSLSNGDWLAQQLAGLTPAEVVVVAASALDQPGLTERYAHLNPGQQRMNAGNRLRAAIKKDSSMIARTEAAMAIVLESRASAEDQSE